LDVLGAVLVLLFFMPIGLAMITAIRCSRRGPIFAREETVGLRPTFGRWRLSADRRRDACSIRCCGARGW
jgi:hypothetical protein